MQVNLLATPFAKLASLDVGRVKIEYREVRRPPNSDWGDRPQTVSLHQ